MKKLLTMAVMVTAIVLSSCEYDDGKIWDSVHGLEDRVAKLEELCKQMNTNISSLQKIVDALQDNLSISEVEQIANGYIIHFSDGSTATIKNGMNSGEAPVIGVNQDTDGVYYWTLNGDWLTDAKGNKVKAQGTDGKDGVDGTDGNNGVDGEDGTDGTDGKDGVTPQLKIEDGRWMLSMDNGQTWTDIGQATGADGKDGKDGIDGKDGMDGTTVFKSVREDDDNVYFELTDGTIITIAKFGQSKEDIDDSKIIQFKDAEVKAICVQNWDTNKDGELSYNEAAKVTSIKKFFRGTAIQSFEELQYFILIDEIEAEAFMQCYELKSITIPDNVTWIEQNAFKNCISLNDITIPNNTTWIGSYAFSGCKKMQNVTLNDNLKIIKDYSFYQCTSLTSIVIPEGVTRIENNAFSSCSSLTSIVIPESVTSIGVGAFSGCSSLTNINIPESVTSIGGSAFSGCSSLTNITIPEGITSIEDWTFRNCSNLINIILPESITKIEKWVFSNCSSLTSITIPKNVASIGTGIFEYTPNLKIVYCAPIDPPAVLNDTFYEMSSNVTFYVPSISVNRYKTAVNWGKYANRIVGYDFTE